MFKHLFAGTLAAATLLAVAPTATLANTPYLLVTPAAATPGSSVMLSGADFSPNEQVSVSFVGASANVTADAQGNFNASLSVPHTQAGTYAATAQGASGQASTVAYVSGFYPRAQPSAWYVLPHQMLGWSGSGFAPGEHLAITDGGIAQFDVTADRNGNFSLPDAMLVPFSWENDTHSFIISGDESSYQIPMTITVGTFYPQLTPSSYFVTPGTAMSLSGMGFAPREDVKVMLDGNSIGILTADAQGRVSMDFDAPLSGARFTVSAQGQLSGQGSARMVTLAQ